MKNKRGLWEMACGGGMMITNFFSDAIPDLVEGSLYVGLMATFCALATQDVKEGIQAYKERKRSKS